MYTIGGQLEEYKAVKKINIHSYGDSERERCKRDFKEVKALYC